MKTVHLRGFADLARATGEGPIPFVAATAGQKADGLNLQMSGVDLDRYIANPVVMYDHEYWGRDALPIGRAENVRTDGDALRTELVFDLEDEFARTVDRKIRGRFLNAVSIGFGVNNIDDAGVPERWELYEISVVPLPMDPNAIADPDRAGVAALARALGPAGLGALSGPVDPAAVRNAITALEQLLTPTTVAPGAAAIDRARRLRLAEASLKV
ncbi:HK97 family phage prohead protease [Herbidospora mongoliensis]|uniref:HK97 family phage prohead protease n=1 Tax=Herbidospora mongoliensis TaxID=688067 RepID=UPI000AA08720|nr:HK97 family phage prohead protease [Herbidospora mongoliensis]